MRTDSRPYHSHPMSHHTITEPKMRATAIRYFWAEVAVSVLVGLGAIL